MKKNKEIDLLMLLVRLVTRGSWILVFGGLLALIYIPYADSINSMFDPPPPQLTGSYASAADMDPDKVVDGIHVASGMKYDDNFMIVRAACTSCHSAKLVTQNRATREGWKQMIRWMQATQGLHDLGKDEGKILDYLAKNYAPEDVGRRKSLDQDVIEWYTLKLE
ncbi:MAG: hypothetical protein P1U56_05420 [Saprospiraceae bacterium]|nr:hypothetical protein [Saprospiraceae bacterium]